MAILVQSNKKPSVSFPSQTGAIVNFNSQYAGLPLKSHTVALTATQSGSGTPSPDNVRAINGYSNINIMATGKNLVDFTARTVTAQSRIIDNLHLNKGDYRFKIRVVNNTNINGVFSVRIGTTNIKTIGFNGNFEGIVSTTFNLTENSVINIILDGGSAGYSFDISNAQIEIGTASTPYTPYNGSFTTITIGSTVYGGEYDARTGVLTITHKYLTFDYTSPWMFEVSSVGRNFYSACPSDIKTNQYAWSSTLICSASPISTRQGAENDHCFISASRNFNFTWGDTLGISTAQGFKDYLQANNIVIEVVAELATPQTIQLPPCPIDTLEGVNNIWADTGDTTVQYIKIGG